MSIFSSSKNKVTTAEQLRNLILNEAKRLEEEGENLLISEPQVKYFSNVNVVMTPEELVRFEDDLMREFEDKYPDVSFTLEYEENGNRVAVKGFYVWLDVMENPEVLYKTVEEIVKYDEYPHWYKFLTGEEEPQVYVWLTREEFDNLVKRLEELLKEYPKYVVQIDGEEVGDDVVVTGLKVRKASKYEKPRVYVEVL